MDPIRATNKKEKIFLPNDFNVYETHKKVRPLKGGLCWQDAFIDPTPKIHWAMIKELRYFAKTARLSNEYFQAHRGSTWGLSYGVDRRRDGVDC